MNFVGSSHGLKDRAILAKESKDYLTALNLLNEAIELNPHDHLLYGHRSTVLLKLGRHSESQRDVQKCFELEALSKVSLESEEFKELQSRSNSNTDLKTQCPCLYII